MWIDRHSEIQVRRMAEQFPAVLVTGARQTGKTSLLRHLYPRAAYLSLDLPANAEAAGLRAIAEAEKGRVKERYVVCRTDVTYKLADGTWVMNLSELLKTLCEK